MLQFISVFLQCAYEQNVWEPWARSNNWIVGEGKWIYWLCDL